MKTVAPFELGEDQVHIRELVRRVANERVANRAAEIDATGDYPQDMYDLLTELGYLPCPSPRSLAAPAACYPPA